MNRQRADDGEGGRWRFAVDRGGTFTDVVGIDPMGRIVTAKLLSSDPGRYRDAAVEGIRRLTGVLDGPLPPLDMRIGTTIATNALLERQGEPTLLLVTRGHADALTIGYQERPDLFARAIVRPDPLHARVVEVDERVTAEGRVLVPLDEVAATDALAQARADGFTSVAILLVHGYRHIAHEARLAELARAAGFTQVSASHRVGATIRLIGRGHTTVADAYLSPVLGRYVDEVTKELGAARPLFMQSNGALADGGVFSGKDAILSGPAGGIVGMARTAAEAGFTHVIGFDMGGTSTDVSHFAGQYERQDETVVAGARIRAPMLRIHTVAAGGGSICAVANGRPTVGPASAGAVPGPAAYRRGGPLTVTDCNVALGKLRPDLFPAIFGADGDRPLDAAAAAARLEELRTDLGDERAPELLAEGLVAIAVASMANAIRKISIEQGHDVTRYTLACFGGAGGQHACLVADALAIDRVMIHPLAGVLSAHGIGLADRGLVHEATVALAIEDAALDPAVADIVRQAEARADVAGIGAARTLSIVARIRRAGSEWLVDAPWGSAASLAKAYAAQHRARLGYAEDRDLVVEAVRVDMTEEGATLPGLPVPPAGPMPDASGMVPIFMDGAWRQVPVHARETLPAGAMLAGPALVLDPVSTIVVEPGWAARVDGHGNLILDRAVRRAMARVGTALDPVRLELFNGLFMALAEEMGAALQASALSVNIRERLDFSCAIFDAGGALVANAPHMPVHLGSMGDSIRAIVSRRSGGRDGRGIRPGDAYALNAPYDGGTHLPDITVVMPVFANDGDAGPAFFVAARGHHADVGGISPGSMPPASTDVREEGVLIDNLLIVESGRFLEGDVRTLLASGAWPARDPDRNVADLQAQVAACRRGAAGLAAMVRDYGADVVAAYMGHVQANAEEAVRALLGRLDDGDFAYEMDDGAVVRVAIRIDRQARAATVDFTGTSAQRPTNFNAPRSITRAAVLYVFRTLVDAAIPMNDGCLRPIDIVVPDGSMLAPRFPAAVVAGNVETSQVVTDALFGALGAMAGAQGTMNNFTFGDAHRQYYETIAGGSGAGPGFAGTGVVQTHMTNSRLTDPEILETRFPVILEEFSIRRGSGGAGRWPGGDGARRRLLFREGMTAGILANRRRVPPFGLAGGAPGDVGRAWVERADGSIEAVGSTGSAALAAGDAFVIETPGGGGHGTPA